MIIRPAKTVKGTLALPGDKSISHRAAMMAALARGTTKIENYAPGADCASTLSCLKQLGVEISRNENTVTITGKGKRAFTPPTQDLDCGNSGSTMRMMAGILAGQHFSSRMIGDASLSSRPMGRVIGPLTEMGAKFDSDDGHAPLIVHGRAPLKAINYTLPKPSAQIKSCVLLAGLFGDGNTEVIETVPTRDHTERMLPHFGVEVEIKESGDNQHISVSGDAELTANDLIVPADISSAAFFMVAAGCLPGSELVLENLGLNPSRTAIIDVMKSVGVNIAIKNERFLGHEPVGDVVVRGGELRTSENIINGKLIAALIDEIPVLAVLGTQLEGGIEIRDADELRVKESDRIKSVVHDLRAMGAAVEEFPDGLRVERSNLKGAVIESFHDHRIAMAFAIAGLIASGETEILDPECAGISFPGFFTALEQLTK